MESTAEVIETNLKLNPKLKEDQKAPLSPSLQKFLTAWDTETVYQIFLCLIQNLTLIGQ